MPARSVQDYIETALEPLGDSYGGLGADWGDYLSAANPYTLGGLYNPVSEPGRFIAPPPIFPTVRVVPPGSGSEDSATPGAEALPPIVVDPEFETQTTVFERPGLPTATRTRPTDWDWVYDQYVILNAPQTVEANVGLFEGVDWGSIAGGIVGGLFDPFGAGAAVQTAFSPPGVVPSATAAIPGPPGTIGITGGTAMAGCPPVGPKYAKICLATREITPLRRRRRRRLLTSSDIKDLAALKAIVGGAALQGAVVQAIRR